MCCVDCGDPAMVEDVVDSWLEEGEVVQFIDYLCLGDKIRRQQERRKNRQPSA